MSYIKLNTAILHKHYQKQEHYQKAFIIFFIHTTNDNIAIYFKNAFKDSHFLPHYDASIVAL